MDLDRFIEQRRGGWTRLESLLRKTEEEGFETFNASELRDLGILYRQASSDLVYTRSALQNAELADFLNQLVASAYGAIYRKSRFTFKRTFEFFRTDLPSAVRRNVRTMTASAVVTLFGVAAGGGLVLADPDAFAAFVPSEYHRLYGKKQDDLRKARFSDPTAEQQAAFSGHLFTNNIRVSLMAFALGIGFGFFTLLLLFYNGALLGAIAANALKWGQSAEFWALILPHGGIELSCVIVAGGTGLMVARALIAPGRRPRGDALGEAAREAVPIALAMAPFLVLAGFLEAFMTPSAAIPVGFKLAFGAVTGVLFWVYLLVPRVRRA